MYFTFYQAENDNWEGVSNCLFHDIIHDKYDIIMIL